jgi:uncharacterized membrane protein YqjE
MTDQQQSTDTTTQNIAEAIQEVSDRVSLLVHEEIELAKAEVTEKVTKLIKGAVVGIVAGIFMIFGLFLLLDGFAWLAYWAIPFPEGTYFWGFFVVAAVLFLLGALGGYIAARAMKSGAPPTPVMAIDEAKLIKETVQSKHPERTI